jgi:DNA replication and repair protein RecF
MVDSAYALRRLSLTAFRNYPALRLDVAAQPVVLVGPNGGGKTNILEAISLLSPGRGLRRASLADLQSRQSEAPWAIVAEIDNPAGFATLATGLDPEASGLPKRLVRVDGKPARNQSVFLEQLNLSWVTPELDRILAEGQSARRKLLDRLVYGFDPAHAGRVTRYEESMRERLRLLRDGPAEPAWLNALEDVMATSGTAIAAARLQMAQQLNAQMAQVKGAFPAAELQLTGLVEESLRQNPALVTEDVLRMKLAAARNYDQQSGTTSMGPQRSDLTVIHRPQNMPAELCSTGEQKALLITIMLCHAQLLRQWRGVTPLLLLDDIASHLDAVRRDALYEWLLAAGSQFWLSGTETALFSGLQGKAQFFHVQQNGVKALAF